jgi:hypothetical protein
MSGIRYGQRVIVMAVRGTEVADRLLAWRSTKTYQNG